MKDTLHPLFTDVTWGAGGSTADLSLRIALQAHQTGHVANLHLTCTNLPGDNPHIAVRDALQAAHDGGIRNIVALRGDPPAGQDTWVATDGGFTCALDLVTFIRQEFGADFGVAVAGYPEGHPNAISEIESEEGLTPQEMLRCSTFDGKIYCCKDDDYAKEMDYLKKKVDAGAGRFSRLVILLLIWLRFTGLHCTALHSPRHHIIPWSRDTELAHTVPLTHIHSHTHIHIFGRFDHHTNVFRCRGLQTICYRLSHLGHHLSCCARSHVHQCVCRIQENGPVL